MALQEATWLLSEAVALGGQRACPPGGGTRKVFIKTFETHIGETQRGGFELRPLRGIRLCGVAGQSC